jgi:hypothetical protein
VEVLKVLLAEEHVSSDLVPINASLLADFSFVSLARRVGNVQGGCGSSAVGLRLLDWDMMWAASSLICRILENSAKISCFACLGGEREGGCKSNSLRRHLMGL